MGDESIYIDCQPVNEFGETDDDSNKRLNNGKSGMADFLDITTDSINSGAFVDNVGIQTIIAIIFFIIIYFTGQYVFKSIPKSLYEKKMRNNQAMTFS